MLFTLAEHQQQARPRIVVGIIGAVGAMVSFFFLPAYATCLLCDGGSEQPRSPSAWEVWQQLAAVPSQDTAPILLALSLLPVCALVTCFIGCAGLVRPLPRLLLVVWTTAAWTGLVILCLFLFLGLAVPNLGYLGMALGYLWILIERNALALPRRGILLLAYGGHDTGINAIAWSPDGKQMASGGQDQTVQVWEATPGKHTRLWSRSQTGEVRAVAWSPDGHRIASGSDDGTVQVWEARNGNLLSTYHGHAAGVTSVAWSPDGQRLASGSHDQTIHLWGVAAAPLSPVTVYRGHEGAVRAVVWSPTGKRMASGSDDGTVHVWDPLNARKVLTYAGQAHGLRRTGITSVAWSPDGWWIASASHEAKTVQIWNSGTKAPRLTYRGHSQGVTGVAWSPDGKRIASASRDGTVHLWEAGTGTMVYSYHWAPAWVRVVAWSPEGTRIAVAGEEQRVQVWSAG